MKKLAVLFATALYLGAAAGQEVDYYPVSFVEPKELQPEPSFFEFDDMSDAARSFLVARDFEDFLRPGPFATMIANQTDHADASGREFGIKVDLGTHPDRALVGLELNVPREKRGASLDEILAMRRKAPSHTCAVPIDRARGTRIESAWDKMVVGVRARTVTVERKGSYEATPPMQLEYHFINVVGAAARALRPVPHLKPGVMAALGTAMFDYCMTKQPEALALLDAKLTELESLLARDEGKP